MKKQYDFSKVKRGSVVKTARAKTRIAIRLDSSVVHWFRSKAHKMGGANYQDMINKALRPAHRRRVAFDSSSPLTVL
jgi:uncharacterized protein (DUF4415 family)